MNYCLYIFAMLFTDVLHYPIGNCGFLQRQHLDGHDTGPPDPLRGH